MTPRTKHVHNRIRTKLVGQSVSEYTVLLSIVAIACIAALSGLGQELSLRLTSGVQFNGGGNISGNTAPQNNPSGQLTGQAPPTAHSPMGGAANATALPQTFNTSLQGPTLVNGQYRFEVLPGKTVGLDAYIETSGALGTVNVSLAYAKSLKEIGQALQETAPELGNAIYNLGLRGENVAAKQSDLLSAHQFAAGDYLISHRPDLKQAYEAALAQHDPAQGLLSFWHVNETAVDGSIHGQQQNDTALNAFKAQWQTVQQQYQAGTLPPQTKHIVNLLAKEIVDTGQNFQAVELNKPMKDDHNFWILKYNQQLTQINAEKIKGCADHQC